MKIDLESLAVLEPRLRAELRSAWLDRRQLRYSGYEVGSGEPIVDHPGLRAQISQNIRVPLAGLRAIQLARRTVSAIASLEAKYGVKMAK